MCLCLGRGGAALPRLWLVGLQLASGGGGRAAVNETFSVVVST